MSAIEISGLSIYPVKSAAGIAVDTFNLGSTGPQWDRRWMVVDDKRRFLTQRRLPAMCLIMAKPLESGLELTAEGRPGVVVDNNDQQTPVRVKVWDDEVDALDCGEQAAQWLTQYLKVSCRLVFMPDSTRRPVDPQYARQHEQVSFADGFPLLLVSEASLGELNHRLTAPVNMDRFRPNIVVRGCEAFAEDRWQRIAVAGIEFTVAKPCSRCIIPAINPLSGQKNSEILQVLREFRQRDNAVFFGQNLLHHDVGLLAIGDVVEVLA